MTDSITINKGVFGIITGLLAIVVLGWNIAGDYNARGAKIERLEYQLSLVEANHREITKKYDNLLKALTDQKIAFERLRSAIRQKN